MAWLKGLAWQDWAVLVLLALVSITHATVTGKLQHLPGPIYGGDYYWHYGHAVHLRDGGSVFASSHYAGEHEHYPWLTHAAIALLGFLTGASVMGVTLSILPFITFLGGLAAYLLARRFLNRSLAIPVAVLWAAQGDLPSATPTGVAIRLAIPAVTLAIVSAETLKGRLLAGLVFGLAGLQHVVVFVGAGILILCLAIYRALAAEGKAWPRIRAQALFWLPTILVAVPVALLYWWAPAFIYQNETPNNWQEYSGIGLQGLTVGFVFRMLKGFFLEFANLSTVLISLIALLGLVMAVARPKRLWLPLVLFATGMLGVLHPLVTQPLAGFTLGFYRFPLWLVLAQALFFGSGLAVIYWSVKDNRARTGVLIAGLIIAGVALSTSMARVPGDRWMQHGMQLDESTKALLGLGDWARANTDVDAVFLASHEESGFALNVLSGRKQVIVRRTHASPFVDADRRSADAALILYGNDNATRQALLKKYNVQYYYEDGYAIQNRQQCLALWDQLEQNPDASYTCLRTHPRHEEELRAAGLEVKRVRARLDVASNRAPLFDLLAIKPKERNRLTIQPLFGNGAAAVARIITEMP